LLLFYFHEAKEIVVLIEGNNNARNFMNLHRTFIGLFLPAVFLLVVTPGCVATMKTAKIDSRQASSPALSWEMTQAEPHSDADVIVSGKYSFRSGMFEKFDVVPGADPFTPHMRLGCKCGLIKAMALDMNLKAFFNLYYRKGEWVAVPNLDMALIYGSGK
jgi:hypothetical protein